MGVSDLPHSGSLRLLHDPSIVRYLDDVQLGFGRQVLASSVPDTSCSGRLSVASCGVSCKLQNILSTYFTEMKLLK